MAEQGRASPSPTFLDLECLEIELDRVGGARSDERSEVGGRRGEGVLLFSESKEVIDDEGEVD
jgi:hypothetical protein